MKFLLGSLFFSASLFGAPQNEILVIEELIVTTKKNLDAQEKLLSYLREFNQAREAFLKEPDSAKCATLLVKQAMRLHHYVLKEHLIHLFSADFLQELAFYNQVGNQVIHAK